MFGPVGPRLGALVTVGVRRALYVVLALPAGVAGLAMTAIGMRRRAATSQRLLLHGLLDEPVGRTSGDRVTRHLLLSLPLNLVAFVPAAYVWLVLLLNLGYPLRGDTSAESLRDSWGGPTLAGAWAVHAVGGTLAFVLIGLPVLATVAWLQRRVARAALGLD